MTNHDRRLGELGVLLLDAGMSVTDVRDNLVAVRNTHPAEKDIEFAVLPIAVWVTDRDTGHTTFVQSAGKELSFRQAAHASRLVQQTVAADVALAQVPERIAAIRRMPRTRPVASWVMGSALVAGGLAVVFRCPWWSIVVAFIVGGLVGLTTSILGRTRNGDAVAPFVAAFGATALVGATASIFDFDSVPLYGVCAPIAILVPGALITNALLELTAADIVTGASRLMYGLMMLGFMSVGILAGGAVTGLHIDHDSAMLVGEIPGLAGNGGWQGLPPFPLSWIGVVALAVGVGLAFGAGTRLIVLSVVMMTLTFSVVSAVTVLVGNVVATGFAAAVLFVAARILERMTVAVPATVSFQPAFLLMVPGTVGLVALASMDAGSVGMIFQTFVSLCLGTKIGALIAETLFVVKHPSADHM
ncbi:hypothetical protein GOEFS_106_01240 [Gordonia effusa NBRC 100432]|uniref:Threonine/serine exporter-like N-terminal domain-containing protein n=1 Tax=Gordonia effusa NBRC 100432 TaxID=1077974 RepID=H0R575_9ACTN|nr:threonine/serine exporter family protein [Gordonia effusa]GAB20226.1 hypothetical protein GOEFS_106_01240 [Gordonia effusa NBRC 100432]